MLEAIAIANGLNAEGGSLNMMFATRESHSKLHKALKLRRYHALVPDAWFVRAESLFNIATEIENLGVDSNYGGKSLHEQSSVGPILINPLIYAEIAPAFASQTDLDQWLDPTLAVFLLGLRLFSGGH